jgi:ribonuclease BN (tRNA processing enzyme)
MKLRVLGCSGGIGGDLSTTSFLLDDHILLDCGTGISNLTLDEMKKIKSIFFTHSHLDHIAGLPLLVDSIFDTLQHRALQVYGSVETINALQTHIFNNIIWPDFTLIPTEDSAVLNFNILETGKQYEQAGCQLEMIPVNHVVPTVGYRIECGGGSLAFSADTTTNDSFWARLNDYPSLDYLLVECAFSNSEIEICRLARHYCPELLAADMKKLKHKPKVFISHLKPGTEDAIMSECKQSISGYDLHRLKGHQVININ